MTGSESILQLAATTAAVGMGVVFCALFLLSTYMHYFKVLIRRLEGGRGPKPAKEPEKSAEAPKLAPAPAAEGPAAAPQGEVAAAVAVGLHLRGTGGAPSGNVAAAIAAALAIHRDKHRAPIQAPGRGPVSWKLAGRLESMTSRVRRQER